MRWGRPRRPSLRARIGLAFALAVALVLGCSGVGLLGMTVARRSVEELVGRVQPMQLANVELRWSVTEASRGVRGHLLTGDPRYLDAYERGRRDYPRALAALRSLQRPDEEALVRRQGELGEAWFARPPTKDPADLQRGKQLVDDLLAVNAELDERLAHRQAALEAESGRLEGLVLALLCGLTAAAVSAAVLLAWRTSSTVVVPLARLSDTLTRLTAGDERARVRLGRSSPPEICAVAESVNALAEEDQRLRRAEAERATMRELARQVGLRVREHLDIGRVAAEAVEAVGQALGADRVYMRLVTEETVGRIEKQWWSAAVPPVIEDLEVHDETSLPWLVRLHAAGRAYVIDDTAVEPALASPSGRRLLASTGMRAAVIVPLSAGNELMGLLTVAQVTRTRVWAEPEIALVEAVAHDLGRALEHAHLFGQERRLVESLRELDSAKSDFLSTVSHELRTPLTSIAGYVELLRDEDAGPVTPAQQGMLDVIERNTTRLKSLIEDLLTLSRIEGNAFRLQVGSAPLDVSDLVTAAAATVRPTMACAGLRLHVDPGPEGLVVEGDAGQLERALLNLLSNAAKFSPGGGTVSLRVGRDGEHAVIGVTDTGIGIPEKEQQELFTRFFRGSNATAMAIQGTGLGLTIVRSIVEQHGGTLRMRSQEGLGTTVELRLPLAEEAATGAAGMPALPAQLTGAVRSSGTLT